MINDAQFDYYGRRLATCSADGNIKIFLTKEDEQMQEIAKLQHHQGAVLALSWSHPKFGSLLASCGIDRKVLVWKEMSANSWHVVHEYDDHEGPVNSVEWGPWEYDLILLTASADSCVSVISRTSEDRWGSLKFVAHEGGVNAVSWSPATSLSLLESEDTHLLRRFVSGGADRHVKVWTWTEEHYECVLLDFHKSTVRDVAWCPSLGLARDLFASCSEDGEIIVWTKSSDSEKWKPKQALKLRVPVWTVSWSIAGNALAISASDNTTRILKEAPDDTWEVVSSINESGQMNNEEQMQIG